MVPELPGNVALLMGGLLKLRKHEIETLHETLLVLLEHDDLVLILLMGLVELTIVLQIRLVFFNLLQAIPQTVPFIVQVVDSI